MERFNLRDDVQPQPCGIGLKVIWRIEPEKHQQGLVVHNADWPLMRDTYGGSFLYHLEDNQVIDVRFGGRNHPCNAGLVR